MLRLIIIVLFSISSFSSLSQEKTHIELGHSPILSGWGAGYAYNTDNTTTIAGYGCTSTTNNIGEEELYCGPAISFGLTNFYDSKVYLSYGLTDAKTKLKSNAELIDDYPYETESVYQFSLTYQYNLNAINFDNSYIGVAYTFGDQYLSSSPVSVNLTYKF